MLKSSKLKPETKEDKKTKIWLSDLKKKPREDLTFGQLLLVSHDKFQETDGMLFETAIRRIIFDEMNEIRTKLNSTAVNCKEMTRRFNKFEGNTEKIQLELANMTRIRG